MSLLQLMVVDDEALARSRLRTLLAQCVHPAAAVGGEAANAVQAMELLRRQHFDAILLDVHMPGADGLALAGAMRSLPEPPVIVFVTAHAEHAVKAFELEAVDYLTKPVDLQECTVRIHAALAVKALEAAGLTVNDIAAFIPHQANMRIIETMAKEMGMPDSVVIADDVRVNGNTSAASIPLAMDVLLDQHPELHGKLALLIGYGAGLVYAGQVVELPPKP